MAIKTDKVTLPEVLEKVIEVGGEVQKAQEDVVEESKRIDEHIADPYAHGLRNQKSPLTVYIQTTVKEALDTGVVGSARRLDTPRGIAISGGATAPAIAFDGSKDIALSVTGLDVSKANAGTLATARGGTGRTDGKVTALATARTIAISGAITGAGVAFDGSKNITINTTGFDISKATISGTLTPEKGGTGRTDGKVAAIATKRSFDGINFDGSANVIHYAQCTTAGATAAKTVLCTNFVLITGARITLHFKETNTAANPTLNVNNTGAKAIRYRDTAIPTAYLAANHTYEFVYDGTNWQVVGDFQRDPATANPKSPGTAAVGTSTKFAREDHVHPVQTTISGNAGSATKLQTARKINGTNFDGTQNINIHNFKDAPIVDGLSVIEFTGIKNTEKNGGIIDFHYQGSTVDYTSRIIENTKGNLLINGANIPAGSSGTVLTTTSNLDMSKATGGTLSTARGGTGRTDGKAPALVNSRTIDGVNFNGSANITHYGKCTTIATTQVKVVACTGFTLATGARIVVFFSTTNSAVLPMLNVNSTGEKAIKYQNKDIATNALVANTTYEFVYDGTAWQLMGGLDSTADTKSYIDTKATDLGNSISSLTSSLSQVSTALTQHNSDTAAHPNINVASAKKLTTGRKISLSGGVTGNATFDGTKDISISTTVGNAASATKFATARTITLSGAITGSGNFDGSNNLTITTTATNTGPAHTVSSGTPSGGSNGDIWFQYV